MDLDPQQNPGNLEPARHVKQTPAGLPRYQQIEVAVLIRITAGRGSKHAQAVSAVPPCQPKNFFRRSERNVFKVTMSLLCDNSGQQSSKVKCLPIDFDQLEKVEIEPVLQTQGLQLGYELRAAPHAPHHLRGHQQ